MLPSLETIVYVCILRAWDARAARTRRRTSEMTNCHTCQDTGYVRDYQYHAGSHVPEPIWQPCGCGSRQPQPERRPPTREEMAAIHANVAASLEEIETIPF